MGKALLRMVSQDGYELSFLLNSQQIEKLLSGSSKRMFEDGAEVVLDNYLENMFPDDIQEMKCIVIPSMNEGLVSGNATHWHYGVLCPPSFSGSYLV